MHAMETKWRSGIFKSNLHPTLILTEVEPNSHKIALKDPKWLDVMTIEYKAWQPIKLGP